jgi:Glycosyl hydrolases related to GH101 family, GH129
VAATVHFAHGVMTPVIGWGDPDLKNKQSKYYLGSYYPPDEPQVFFRPVPLKEEYRYIYFEPRFRLPLFEAVFHDSVVATHHWSFASLKARDEAGTVELLELLYQVPPLYHLNLQEFEKRKAQIRRHYRFLSPLHRETALLPLTSFQWLSPDHMVQRTAFGDQLELVANFGTEDFLYGETTIHRRSILATRRDGKPKEYVPQ